MRTYFHKQNKKYNKSGSQSIGFVIKSEHFYGLQFLGDTLEPKQSSSNMELEGTHTGLVGWFFMAQGPKKDMLRQTKS